MAGTDIATEKPIELRIGATQRQREFLYALLHGDCEEAVYGVPQEADWEEVGYGGARGGGKTFASALAATTLALIRPGIRVLLLRKGLASVKQNFRDELAKVSRVLALGKAVRYRASESCYVFGNGSSILFGYCNTDRDFEAYQGIPYGAMGFEEATQMSLHSYISMIGSNRSNIPGGRAYRWITTNPGGPGHEWVRQRFVDDRTRQARTRWVRALVTDNPAMLVYDPGYISRTLAGLPYWRRKQWLLGDWDAMAGQFWDIPPEQICDVEVPDWADWYAGVDWGHARPFAIVYCAFWTEWLQDPYTGEYDPVDRLHVAHVVYRTNLSLDEQAIAAAEAEESLRLRPNRVIYYADPSTSRRLIGVTAQDARDIQRQWAMYGLITHPARSNARVAGWLLIKQLLHAGTMTISPSCEPLLSEMARHVYEGSPGPPTSEDFIQGTQVMDDATDALRYCVVSITGLRPPEKPLSHYVSNSLATADAMRRVHNEV